MDKWPYPRRESRLRDRVRDRAPSEARIVPFGPYGGGQFTGHPIGIIIVIGFIAMALVGVPEARVFFVISLALGIAFGFFLWFRHQSNSAF
jgi:hypothetical protein